MSRMPKDIVEYMKECTEIISEEAVATSIVAVFNISAGKTTWISAMSDNLDNVKSELFRDTSLDFKPLNSTTLLSAQKRDPVIAEILRYKALDRELTKDDRIHETPAVKSLMREWKRLVLGKDEILHRQSGPYLQFVLPSCFHPLIFKKLHNNMGHLGVDRVLALIRECFFWPGMLMLNTI